MTVLNDGGGFTEFKSIHIGVKAGFEEVKGETITRQR
jgi:hypothetical protein